MLLCHPHILIISPQYLPRDFFEKFTGNIESRVVIKVPSGREYGVRVSNLDGLMFFGDGWPLLAEAEEIKEGDNGVFTYLNPAEFKLKIFSACGSEKFASSVGLLHKACPVASLGECSKSLICYSTDTMHHLFIVSRYCEPDG
jgi:hypothetical protein